MMETSSATATTLAPPAGILRRRSSFVSNNSRSNSPNSSRTSMGVHFAPPPNLSELLSSHDFPALEGFITHMRNQQGEALVAWLQALAENMTLLKPKLEPFVLATLDISWAGRSQVCVAAFTQYLTNLLTAQGFYTKPIMMMLVRHLGGGVGSVEDPAEQERVFHNVHSAIKAALDASPLGARTALLSYAKESMPFMLSKNPKAQSAYLKNLMEMSFYVKRDDDRLRLLTLVVDRLVQLDAYLPKLEEEEEDEDTDEQFDMEVETPGRIILDDSSLAQLNLDEAMTMMFEFVGERFIQSRATRRLFWNDLLSVFDSHILTTHATAHVQFLLFRFLALDSEESQSNNIGLSPCTAAYLDWLWNKFQNPNTPSILRQATVCYIASLIARGKFVDLATTRIYLRQMMDWIRSYIATREERSKIGGGSNDPFFCDLKAHGPFYAACQASFYIFAFRHQEFVAGGRKEMEFLSNLGFQQVVTCSLNPLRVIMPPVVKNFTALVRHLQLAYCDTIIARNARISLPVVGSLSQSATTSGKALLLDSFFPFDPYLLKKSRGYIDDSFRTYRGVLIGNDDEEEESDEEEGESVDEEEEDMEDEDSFVSSLTKSGSIKKTDTSIIQQFMYGSSPGFKI